jgi:AAHS family cis,cis-muconate transporter-like MFS transporter
VFAIGIEAGVSTSVPRIQSPSSIYWTAFIGLFFDYYDLYLFVYLEKVLAVDFGLSAAQSNGLQFSGLAGVGVGALIFGYLADRFGRERMLVVVFGVYVLGLFGLSVAWSPGSLWFFRVIASLALGAEWGISHTWMSERVESSQRYRFAALLQFSILGGLLAALAARYALPAVGWRMLFALSIVPVALLSIVRWRWLIRPSTGSASFGQLRSPDLTLTTDGGSSARESSWTLQRFIRANGTIFLRCLLLASLTIASGYVNVFFIKELPQSPFYTVVFWLNVAPGMLLGAWIVRRLGVRQALMSYAVALIVLSLLAWSGALPGGKLSFALVLPILNGIPFGLMGAYFNEVFAEYRTMLSGSAYNLGRILAGFAPLLISALGLQHGGNYFLFSGALGVGVLVIGWGIGPRKTRTESV